MKHLFATAALALTLCVPALAADKISAVTKDKLGQEVTVEGTASSFRASRGPKAPNSFMLKDDTGETRIVIWPDVYEKISGKEALATNGAKVSATGEVAEFKEKIELHVKDAAGVKVQGGDAASTRTVSSTSTQTSSTARPY